MPTEQPSAQSRRPIADSNAARRRKVETVTQRARRYRDAIDFIAKQPDAEIFWGPARDALSYVADGKTISEAWDEALGVHGIGR